MTDGDYSGLKPYFLLLYGAIGLLCLALAVRSHQTEAVGTFETRRGRLIAALLAILAGAALLAKFAASGSYLLMSATAIGTTIFAARPGIWRSPSAILPAIASIALALSLAWWQIGPSPATPRPLIAFACILGLLVFGFSDRWGRRPNMLLLQIVFLGAGLLLLIDLGGYREGDSLLYFLAHHWGAFIGSALHVRAGLVPFYDMPLQYGLGPTLAIASFCGDADCWTNTEIFVVAMSLINALLVLRMALTTVMARGFLWHWAVAITVFAALFLWTAYPADGNLQLAFPSVGGVRFMPTVLVAYLLFAGKPAGAAIALIPALLWSPESAAMSIAVFGLAETARLGFVPAALRSAALLTVSYGGLVLVHRAIFGIWIDPAAFAEYILHVPGPLPIDPFSDTMLLFATLALGIWLLIRRSSDPATARRDLIAVSLLFATASYWLGRSHPNNICNVAPFLVLLALRALDRPNVAWSRIAEVTSIGLASSVAVLAFSPWRSLPYDPRATFDMRTVTAQFRSLEPDIEAIRGQLTNPQGLGIADFGQSYTRHQSETLIWTPMDPSSLWSFVPAERRQLYIERSAARLKRSGWAIFDETQLFLFDDLKAGYVVAEQRRFDRMENGAAVHFMAACFDPRPEIASSITGPTCPKKAP